MKEDAARLRSTVTALGREARDWLGLFLDRLEKVAQDLGGFTPKTSSAIFRFSWQTPCARPFTAASKHIGR